MTRYGAATSPDRHQEPDNHGSGGGGRATKIIIPSNMQGLAGLAVSFKELLTDTNIGAGDQDPGEEA